MAKRLNNMSRRERMIANAIEKMKDHDIYVISEKFIGDYGYISPDMDYNELRYVAGLIANIPLFEDVELNKTQWDYYCSRVHHVNGMTVVLDKGSRKISHNMFVNPRGNVFMIERNGGTHYFNKYMSKFILKNVRWLEQCYTVEEVEQCEGWDSLLRKVKPHIHSGEITIKVWFWDDEAQNNYCDIRKCNADDIMDIIANIISDNTVEFLTLYKDNGEYICTVEYMTANSVPNYPYVQE